MKHVSLSAASSVMCSFLTEQVLQDRLSPNVLLGKCFSWVLPTIPPYVACSCKPLLMETLFFLCPLSLERQMRYVSHLPYVLSLNWTHHVLQLLLSVCVFHSPAHPRCCLLHSLHSLPYFVWCPKLDPVVQHWVVWTSRTPSCAPVYMSQCGVHLLCTRWLMLSFWSAKQILFCSCWFVALWLASTHPGLLLAGSLY